MKILIAVPCMDQVPVPFCYSLTQLEKPEGCSLTMKSGALIYAARDSMAITAIQNEYDYVFWMDSDMQFPADALTRLLRVMTEKDLDIVTGLYFRRIPPYSPVLFDKLEINGVEADYSEFQSIPDGLFEVGGCGFGCVLMKTDVFFDVQSKFEQMFSPIGRNGEDVAFCWRARQCGYKIWCDPSVECGHVGYSVVDGTFFRAFRGDDDGAKSDQ
jgi:GT2 family glycosyltransferase